jgi:hypothetical protein
MLVRTVESKALLCLNLTALTEPPLLYAENVAFTSQMERNFLCSVFRLGIVPFYKRKSTICIDIIRGIDFVRGGNFKAIRINFYIGHHYEFTLKLHDSFLQREDGTKSTKVKLSCA